ncbi:MAG: hypothetical protein ACLRWM_01640 [Streptococcus sp.]
MRYNWKLPIIVICVVLISILGMTFMVQGPKNTAISYEEQIQEAKSGIEIQEKRRADLIQIWLKPSRLMTNMSIRL